MSLLALNGLRVSEAIGADIDALGLERGHRTLTVLRKGGKIATMPLAPRVARAVDLAIVDRVDGAIFVDATGDRPDHDQAVTASVGPLGRTAVTGDHQIGAVRADM